jgi:tetratricopeptide (TPR) repeat protein
MGRRAVNPEKTEDDFASILAAYDDALAQGTSTPVESSVDVPDELRERLEHGVAWCRMVRRLLPGVQSAPSATPGTDSTLGPEPDEHWRFTATEHGLSTGHQPLSRLGRFQIRRELGRGGAGVVFQAFDPKMGREVALKIPRPEAIVLPELRMRFQQEARAAAVLDHPNIVPVYDAGEELGMCYIASAYCPGVTLGAWLRERTEPAPFDDAAGLIATLAEAVEHAHRRGILHRDLKPNNVLLSFSRDAESSEPSAFAPALGSEDSASRLNGVVPRITDFGLAKLLEGSESATLAEHPTRSGTIVGTPAYMSPEQAAGESRAVGPAADVYALGVILYEMLTGRPPFRADTISETLVLVRTEDPLPPGKLRPRLPRDLETICLKCLHKEPHKRYASAQALADDLERFLAREPIMARPESWRERGVKWVRRRPALAALLAVTGTAALAVAVILLAANNRLRRERDNADAARREALAGYRKAREAADKMLQRVGIDVLVYVPHTEVVQRELVEDALKFYEELTIPRSDDPATREELGIVYRRIGAIHSTLGRKPEAEAAYRKSLDVHRALADEFPGENKYRHAVAVDEQNLGNFLVGAIRRPGAKQEAEQSLQRARETLAELVAEYPDSPNFRDHLASTWVSLGDLMGNTNRLSEAENAYCQAIAIREKLAAERPADLEVLRELAHTYHSLGSMLAPAGQLGKAEPALRRAVELSDRLAAAQPGLTAYRRGPSPLLLENLGTLFRNTHRYSEAEKLLTRALEYREKMAADFPSVPEHRRNLARALRLVGDFRFNHLRQVEPARQGAERAIGDLLVLCKADPKNESFRRELRENYSLLAKTLIYLGEHRAAAETAEKMPPLFPDAWQERLSAGWFLARCVPLAERDARLSEAQRKSLSHDYGDRAVRWLSEAVQRGWKDLNFLRKDPELVAVRQREDFQKLLRELAAQPKPPTR